MDPLQNHLNPDLSTSDVPEVHAGWIRRGGMITGLGAIAAFGMVGAEVDAGDVAIEIGEPDWHADGVVAQENMFNEPAPEGTTYVMVPVTLHNRASGDVSPRDELRVRYVAPDGRAYTPERQVVPADLDEVSHLPAGETVTGNVLFAIPTEAQRGGGWVVDLDNGAGPAFVAAV